ncbi:MAG: hypothetical protein RLY71_4207 [Pseudomonadota bacterium]|jgi:molybdate transport system substrate-binding protein
MPTPASATLHYLCAGASKGLVEALAPAFEAQTGVRLAGRFGAVGAMKEALQAGEPCDFMILTDRLIAELISTGALTATGRADLGTVRTGVAVPTSTSATPSPGPDVSTPDALRAALRAASAIYLPDPERATAGIHFARIMHTLGVADELRPRWRTYPNGATAMRELAACPDPGPIGCTQITEINYSPGVRLVGALPPEFELTTVYTAAVGAGAAQAALARQFIGLLAGEGSLALRRAGGFEC